MTPKVALLYPPVTEECSAMRDLGLTPPLHILALAAYIKAEVIILDGAHLNYAQMLAALERFDPDVIGMNVDITNYKSAIAIANATRARIILGGNYAAFLADNILRLRNRVEAVCYNDGELALQGFITGDLTAPNLIHRKGHNPVKILDISKHPTPAYHLVHLPDYFARQQQVFGANFRMLQFYGQKGCLNSPHCTFCGRYEDGMRLRDPNIYCTEVENFIQQWGLTEVWDRSDSYLQSRRWFGIVFERLRHTGVRFKTYARADQLTPDNVHKMHAMNFRMIYIGYEAGDDSLLRAMNKRETTHQYLDATKRVLDAGIDIDASFIIGLPGENQRTMENQIQFVQKLSDLGLKKIKVNRVLVLPGTPLYARVCAAFPEVRELDTVNIADLQKKLYTTYPLPASVEQFAEQLEVAAAAMMGIITRKGGCAEGYGLPKGTVLTGKEGA
jgi:radical SAM superfamily enzyme YgiQ (UPF0313 family)